MVRVLQIAASLGAGGAEKLVYDLALRQVQRGHSVVIALLSTPAEARSKEIDAKRREHLRTQGVEVLAVGRGSRDIWSLRTCLASREMQQIDVIHAHTLPAVVGAGSASKDRALLLTLHNTDLAVPTRGIRLTLPWVDRYIACSDAVSRAFAPHLGKKLFTVRNGVDISLYAQSARSPGDEHNVFRVVSVGAMRPQKNYVRLVRAAKLAGIRLLESGIRLLVSIVGDGSERAAVEGEIAQLQCASIVELLGTRSDVIRLLAGADAYVMSSDHEGLPLSLLEAMAAGVPPIVTPFPGASDVVVAGESGLIIRSFSHDDLAAAVADLGLDGDLRRRLAAGAAARARMFDIDACAQGYERHYEELLCGRSRSVE